MMSGVLVVLVACLASASAQFPFGMGLRTPWAALGFRTGAQTTEARTVTCLGYSESASFAATFEETSGWFNSGNTMTANIEMAVSPTGAGVYQLVITERSRGSGQCASENLGPIMTNLASGRMGAMGGLGAMGAMGGFSPASFMNWGGFAQQTPAGLLREVRLTSSRLTGESIANVPFTREQLAGHGLALCSRTTTNQFGDLVCDGTAVACCTLGYDNGSQHLPTTA